MALALALAPATTAGAADQNGSCTISYPSYPVATAAKTATASQTQSFDGSKFEIVGAGQFTLLASSALQVQVTIAPYADDGKHFAVSGVALKFGSTVLVYNTRASGAQPQLRSATSAGVTVSALTGNVTLSMTDGSSVQIVQSKTLKFPGDLPALSVTVVEPPGAAGKTRGICGNFDKKPDNDNKSPSGESVSFTAALNFSLPNATDFARAWAVPSKENLFSGSLPPPYLGSVASPAGADAGVPKSPLDSDSFE